MKIQKIFILVGFFSLAVFFHAFSMDNNSERKCPLLNIFKLCKKKKNRHPISEIIEVETYEDANGKKGLRNLIRHWTKKLSGIDVMASEFNLEPTRNPKKFMLMTDFDETLFWYGKKVYLSRRVLREKLRKKEITEEQYKKYICTVLRNSDPIPIKLFPDFLDLFQKAGIPVVGVTDTTYGDKQLQVYMGESAKIRNRQSIQAGFNKFASKFSMFFPKYEIPREFQCGALNAPDIFRFADWYIMTNGLSVKGKKLVTHEKKLHGICNRLRKKKLISGNLEGKGFAVHKFLKDLYKHTKYWPSKGIIFIDNLKANVEHVQEMAKFLGLPFIGFFYTEHADKYVTKGMKRTNTFMSYLENLQNFADVNFERTYDELSDNGYSPKKK
jgi:hypothetical protein